MTKSSKHRNGAENRVTVYERVTAKVTELLKQGHIPWQKPWHAKVGPPRNGVSGRYYRGLNVFMLSHAGFESPWWLSPKQVNDLDGHINKGEKVSWVHFWKPWLPKGQPDETLEVDTDEVEISTRRRPVLIIRAYRVVNLDQCSGPGHRQIPRETSGRRAGEQRQRSDRGMRGDCCEHAPTSGYPARRGRSVLPAVGRPGAHAEARNLCVFRGVLLRSCFTS